MLKYFHTKKSLWGLYSEPRIALKQPYDPHTLSQMFFKAWEIIDVVSKFSEYFYYQNKFTTRYGVLTSTSKMLHLITRTH